MENRPACLGIRPLRHIRTTHLAYLTVVLFLTLFARTDVAAQGIFERTFGGPEDDAGYDVQETTEGGFVIVGVTKSFGAGGKDIYLLHTNASGDTLWSRTYGGDGYDYGWSVRQTTDGGFIIAGATDSFGTGNRDVYLIRADTEGDTLWTRTYGGSGADDGNAVRQLSDGGFIIAGSTSSFGTGQSDVYLIRTGSSGDTLWTRTYGGSDYDYARDIEPTSDDGFVVVGETRSFGDGYGDVYLLRTDASGDTLWMRTYGGLSGDTGFSVQETTDNGFILSGETSSFGNLVHGDFYLIKTDSAGDTLWTRAYGGDDLENGWSVLQTDDGGYIVAGTTYSYQTMTGDFYLVRTDSNGDSLWTRTIGGNGSDYAYAIQPTADGGFVLVGETESSGAGLFDIFLVKVEDSPTGIGGDGPIVSGPLPRAFVMSQNYPNPFNPSTTIRYDIPDVLGTSNVTGGSGDMPSVPVRIFIYDIRGRLVKKLVNQDSKPGRYQVHWDGRDGRGQFVASGVYLYRIDAGDFSSTKKMVLVR